MKKPVRDTAGLISGLSRAAGFSPKADPKAPAVVPKSRQGTKAILTYHDPAVAQQLKLLSAETGITQQKLVAEALNMLFAKYGKGQIA